MFIYALRDKVYWYLFMKRRGNWTGHNEAYCFRMQIWLWQKMGEDLAQQLPSALWLLGQCRQNVPVSKPPLKSKDNYLLCAWHLEKHFLLDKRLISCTHRFKNMSKQLIAQHMLHYLWECEDIWPQTEDNPAIIDCIIYCIAECAARKFFLKSGCERCRVPCTWFKFAAC